MSIASQHTPAPWEARREFTSLCIVDDAGDYIADIHDRETYDENLEVEDEAASHAEAEANARLIAASPDLLEALRPFVHEFNERREAYIRRYPRNPGVGANNFDSMPDEWPMERLTFTMGDFRRASAAIAKAVSQ